MERLIKKLILELDQNGWDAIKDNKKEILTFDGKEFMINLLNNNDLRYTHAPVIFLIIPEIWKDFNLQDWKYVIHNIERPAKYRILFDDSPNFEDLKFLYNWIGIDSIKLCNEDDALPIEKKKAINRVLPNFLIHNLGDGEEDFADGTFGKKEYFITMKQRLISQGATSV
jgi:hypothetical protein